MSVSLKKKAWRITDTFSIRCSAHHSPANRSWGQIGQTISNSSKESHENTKLNVNTLHLSSMCGFAVGRCVREETKVRRRSNILNLSYKQLINVDDFPSCCFVPRGIFAWEHLVRKDTGTMMCTGLIYQLYLDKMKGINLLKITLDHEFYSGSNITRDSIVSKYTRICFLMSCTLCFVLALQIISVRP